MALDLSDVVNLLERFPGARRAKDLIAIGIEDVDVASLPVANEAGGSITVDSDGIGNPVESRFFGHDVAASAISFANDSSILGNDVLRLSFESQDSSAMSAIVDWRDDQDRTIFTDDRASASAVQTVDEEYNVRSSDFLVSIEDDSGQSSHSIKGGIYSQ